MKVAIITVSAMIQGLMCRWDEVTGRIPVSLKENRGFDVSCRAAG